MFNKYFLGHGKQYHISQTKLILHTETDVLVNIVSVYTTSATWSICPAYWIKWTPEMAVDVHLKIRLFNVIWYRWHHWTFNIDVFTSIEISEMNGSRNVDSLCATGSSHSLIHDTQLVLSDTKSQWSAAKVQKLDSSIIQSYAQLRHSCVSK